MKTANSDVNVLAYDRPTDLPDGEKICHGCGQLYNPAHEGTSEIFCWFCAPVTEDRARDGPLTWTETDILSTLTIVFDNEALAILRMAQA